jgi:protease-4
MVASEMCVKRKIEKVTIYRVLPFLDTSYAVFYIALSKYESFLCELCSKFLLKEEKMRRWIAIVAVVMGLFLIGCHGPRIRLFPSAADPLREHTLEGTAKGKVLVIHVRGTISDEPRRRIVTTRPSLLQEVVSQLRKAEKDPEIKALLLKINSPGGSTTASDILYQEIVAFKQKTQTKVVVAMMDVAASGGYYIALPADFILAHPTSVTGSVGVLFLRPDLVGLIDKVGIGVDISKTGKNKDMGSPFRQATDEEKQIIQDMIDQLGARFLDRIEAHRRIDPQSLKEISSARIYLAADALRLGMVDQVGYLSEAVGEAKKLSGLPENAKVIVYRRTRFPDDNLYNPSTSQYEGQGVSMVSVDLPASLTIKQAGFYYLWQPGVMGE